VIRRCSFLAIVLASVCAASAASAQSLPPAAQRLYQQARNGKWSADAERLAPAIVPTSDGRSFLAVWKNPGTQPEKWVVSLHGSNAFATDDLVAWQRYLEPRGIGLLTLQWWFGRDEGPQGYYTPEQIYRELDIVLRKLGVAPGTAMLHGFSRGAANIYAVAALDAMRPTHYFSLVVANAGRASMDFAPTRAVTEGRFGDQPFRQTRWVIVCGGRDPNPERDGCPGMSATKLWLAGLGAQAVAVIEDPEGGHDVFHRNARHVNRALDLFEGRAKP
jgi:hypothetical protein